MIRSGILFFLCAGLLTVTQAEENDFDKRVRQIHDKALTVDTHCDTPMDMVRGTVDVGVRNDLKTSRVDFPRMKEGGLDALFFAAFTGQKERTDENIQEAYDKANDMISSIRETCEKYGDQAEVAVSADDAERLEREGKRAIYIGMENGFPLGTDIKRVGEFYDKGVRYITLCHSYNNDICDSSSDKKGPDHNGLSRFGKRVVRKMNRKGMLIDVSHCSDKSFYDILKASKSPVIASHSSVRALADSKRNLTDDMIRALADNGGVIQICLLDAYVKDPDTGSELYRRKQELRGIFNDAGWEERDEKEKEMIRVQWRNLKIDYLEYMPTVADYVDHIDHVKNLVGIDYVGIGSDFDGGGGINGCADVSEMPNITAEMLRRGYTEEEIMKVWGGNFFRVFRENENNSR